MTAQKQKLVPQAKEGINKAKWVNLDDFMSNKPKIFRNIKDIIQHYRNNERISI